MKFSELHDHIPLARYGKEKSLTMTPYKGITLAMPGRHAEDTSPKGGDFVVMVTDKTMGWNKHQFTHTDLFKIVEQKMLIQPNPTNALMGDYLNVVAYGHEPPVLPASYQMTLKGEYMHETISDVTFLYAVQCLAVAEHRRYHQHEAKFGGRFLPFRFAAGIAQGLWTSTDAADKQKRGRPGVEWLEKDFGMPDITKQLMGK